MSFTTSTVQSQGNTGNISSDDDSVPEGQNSYGGYFSRDGGENIIFVPYQDHGSDPENIKDMTASVMGDYQALGGTIFAGGKVPYSLKSSLAHDDLKNADHAADVGSQIFSSISQLKAALGTAAAPGGSREALKSWLSSDEDAPKVLDMMSDFLDMRLQDPNLPESVRNHLTSARDAIEKLKGYFENGSEFSVDDLTDEEVQGLNALVAEVEAVISPVWGSDAIRSVVTTTRSAYDDVREDLRRQ